MTTQDRERARRMVCSKTSNHTPDCICARCEDAIAREFAAVRAEAIQSTFPQRVQDLADLEKRVREEATQAESERCVRIAKEKADFLDQHGRPGEGTGARAVRDRIRKGGDA